MKHLWEHDHPYYCDEGNFFHSPRSSYTVHEEMSWAEFKATLFYAGDRDLNLLFRWDWKAWHLEYPEDYPDEEGRTENHVLQLYFVLQRKPFNCSAHVAVTPADEPEVRAWLEECAKTMCALWEPIIAGISS